MRPPTRPIASPNKPPPKPIAKGSVSSKKNATIKNEKALIIGISFMFPPAKTVQQFFYPQIQRELEFIFERC